MGPGENLPPGRQREAAAGTPPALVLADDDPAARADLAAELARRYGNDYQVVTCGTGDEALARVAALAADATPIAVVLADVDLGAASGDGGLDFLARMGTVAPQAKRVLLSEARVRAAGRATAVQGAVTRGVCDLVLAKPQARRDEHFHWLLTDLLRQWGRVDAGRFEAVVVVGHRWHRRTSELRDLLERFAVPYGWHVPDSGRGRALRAQHGDAGLPLLVLPDGRALADPSNAGIADALGAGRVPGHDVDLAVVGGGPAGLAAAVYGASEGLEVVVVEREAMGGQAGRRRASATTSGSPTGCPARTWLGGPPSRQACSARGPC